MHFLALMVAIPAFIFFVFAVALGLDPLKAAAWGAISGMALLVIAAAILIHNG
jgi:hypothetical protein